MDVQTEYYIRKYNNLLEQIKKLEHENKLLEDLTGGGIVSGPGSGFGSSLDDDDFSTTTGPGSGSGSGSGTNPPPPKPSGPRPFRLKGTSLKDVGLDSRRQDF